MDDRRLLWRVEVPAGLLLALERLFFSAALLVGAIASYGFWGNPDSPLRYLWRAALLFALLWGIAFCGHVLFIRRLRHHERALRRVRRLRAEPEAGETEVESSDKSHDTDAN